MLLAVLGGGGGFLDVGYSMSANEVAFWRDMAALLDPDAYELVVANDTDQTVPSGENWYLQEGWNLEAAGAGNEWFHRGGDVRDGLFLPEGTVIGTDQDPAGPGSPAHMYLCKPALVADEPTDDRYTDYQSDPRALYFERLRRLSAELPQERIGTTNTGSTSIDVAFPATFTDGMIVHVSTQDLAWVAPCDSGETFGLITQMEVSDIDPVRVAAVCLIPFKRATIPKVLFQGANLSTGRGTVTFVPLPSDW